MAVPSKTSTGATATTDNATSITPAIHGSASLGDLLVLYWFGRDTGAGAIPGTPSGWTLQVSNVASKANYAVWTRVYQSGDSGPTLTHANSIPQSAFIASYSGYNPTTPIAAINTQSGANNNSLTWNTITSTLNDNLVVVVSVATLSFGAPGSYTPSGGGLTWTKDFEQSAGITAYVRGVVSTAPQATAGAVSSVAATTTGNPTWATRGFVIQSTPAGSNISFDRTLGAFTLTANIEHHVGISFSRTLGAFTLTANLVNQRNISFDRTLGSFTLSAQLFNQNNISFNRTLANFTLDSTIQTVFGPLVSFDRTLGSFTLSATIVVPVGITFDRTLGSFTLSSNLIVQAQGVRRTLFVVG